MTPSPFARVEKDGTIGLGSGRNFFRTTNDEKAIVMEINSAVRPLVEALELIAHSKCGLTSAGCYGDNCFCLGWAQDTAKKALEAHNGGK